MRVGRLRPARFSSANATSVCPPRSRTLVAASLTRRLTPTAEEIEKFRVAISIINAVNRHRVSVMIHRRFMAVSFGYESMGDGKNHFSQQTPIDSRQTKAFRQGAAGLCFQVCFIVSGPVTSAC